MKRRERKNPVLQDALKRTCTLPSVANHFTGRNTERGTLISWLTTSSDAGVVIVQGHGGLGKTSLAVRAGHQLLESHGVRVVTARLQNAKNVFDILYSLLSSLRVSLNLAEIGSRTSVLEGLLLSQFREQRNNTLIILDGCEVISEIEETCDSFWGIIERLLETCHNVLILCTTQRDISTRHHCIPTHVLRLEALSEDDAKEVVKTLCPQLNSGQVNLVAEACAFIPSILDAACDLLQPISANMDPQRLIGILSAKLSHKFEACFDLTYRSLSAEEQRCLQCLSVFPVGFTFNDAEPLLADEARSSGDILRLCHRRSFLNLDTSTDEPCFTMQGTLKAFIKTKLTDRELGSIEKHFILTLDSKVRTLSALCKADELRKASQEFSSQRENLMQVVAIFCKPTFQYKPLVSDTIAKLAHVLYTLAMYRGAFQSYEALLRLKSGSSSEVKCQEVAHIRRMLGCIQYKLAQYKEAAENVHLALGWYRQGQQSSTDIPLCFHTLGLIHGESGDMSSALQMFQQTLQWCEENSDEEIATVCSFGIELVKTLCAASDFDKSDEEFTAAAQQYLILSDEKVRLDPDGIGLVFDISRARRSARQSDTRGAVLRMRAGIRRVLGDYPYSSLILIVFVEVLFLSCEQLSHYSLVENACRAFQQVCDNEDTAILFSFKAFQSGKDSAREAFDEALEILQRILGDHLWTVFTLQNKAKFLQSQKSLEESSAVYQVALAMVERIVCDHPIQASVMHELGLVMVDMERKDEGLGLCHRALDVRTRVLGDTHPVTLETKKILDKLTDKFEELDLCTDSDDEDW